MNAYHDPRAELDYSEFQEVDPALDRSGYLPGKVVARPNTIDADYVGPNPRSTPFGPGEREQFQAVRSRLDRALQVCRITPSTPQEKQTPVEYEAELLRALQNHTTKPISFSAQDTPEGVIATCTRRNVVADALAEPYRKGELRQVLTFDQAGREIREFVGVKSQWMNPLKSPAIISPIYIDDVPQQW